MKLVKFFLWGISFECMPMFTIQGQFRSGTQWAPFKVEIDAQNSDLAVEHCYANFGSKHHLKRNQIIVEEVSSDESS